MIRTDPSRTMQPPASSVPEFRFQMGALRRRWQWAGVLVALVFSGTFGWTLWQGYAAGAAFWLAQAGLALAAGTWWRRLHGADAREQWLRYGADRWWLNASSTRYLWQPLPATTDGAGRAVVLPGVVVLGGGRVWLFPDECPPDEWRRLNVCARWL